MDTLSSAGWVPELRLVRNPVDPLRPYAFFSEEERAREGEILPVNTVFLTNRECPWRCVMCDLWKNTLEETVPAGAIPAQIDYALERLKEAHHIKLYNSGSFFDARAIAPDDYEAIAARIRDYRHVIVECHPALIGESCLRFRDLLSGRLEVAMGLETVHPEALRRLNKHMTLEQFGAAAAFLKKNDIDLRAFILVQPPFVPVNEARHWAGRSVNFAFECGAPVATLIPTRGGNMPRVELLECCVEDGIGMHRGRVFGDVWDLERFSRCAVCFEERKKRLEYMNLHQTIPAQVVCEACSEG